MLPKGQRKADPGRRCCGLVETGMVFIPPEPGLPTPALSVLSLYQQEAQYLLCSLPELSRRLFSVEGGESFSKFGVTMFECFCSGWIAYCGLLRACPAVHTMQPRSWTHDFHIYSSVSDCSIGWIMKRQIPCQVQNNQGASLPGLSACTCFPPRQKIGGNQVFSTFYQELQAHSLPQILWVQQGHAVRDIPGSNVRMTKPSRGSGVAQKGPTGR